jgi:RNA polymerase sigma-70 factor (ECF subfamily)
MVKDKKVTDVMLLEQFRGGMMEAFEELVIRYESKVFNLAMRFTRNQEDAEEVLQDVFTTVFRKAAGFEGKSAFSSWLYRIVVNASFMKLRKRKQSPAVSIEDLPGGLRETILEPVDGQQTPTDLGAESKQLREAMSGAIDRLPGQYRAVFVLRDVDGLSNQEVGEILGLTVPAVKSRLHRSRLMLRRKLLRYYEEYAGGLFEPEKVDASVG